MSETATTVTKIDAADLDPMRREVNHGLMVQFINRELLDRAHLDVRKSVVLYDDDKLFVAATDNALDEGILQKLFDTTSVRFWSVGV